MLSAELQELRDDLRAIRAGIRQVERDVAWNRVIDSAIRMCRLLCKAELAELDAKYRADQPRVPAGNPDGGQWTDVGGAGEAATNAGETLTDAQPDDLWKPGADYAQLDHVSIIAGNWRSCRHGRHRKSRASCSRQRPLRA